MLFSQYTRDYFEHRTRKLTAYEFFDKSAWKIADLMRDYYSQWGSDFFSETEFLSKFKSKDDKQHYAASFELLTYALLIRSKFIVEKHPFTGVTRRLDFSAKSVEGHEYYIECTLSGNSFENLKEKNQKGVVEGIIDEIEYYPYFINLDFNQTSDVSISKKRLIRFINEVKEKSEGIPNEHLFHCKHFFEDNGWEIEISLLRKTDPKIKRSLGYITQDARTINTSKPIITALKDKKPGSYGITSLPYIICLNTSDLFTQENCFSEALFGQYGSDKIDLECSYEDGFFLTNKKSINTTVSGVIIFRNLDAFTLDSSSATFWHNPFAKNPVPINTFPFDEYVFENTGTFLEKRTVKKERDFFSLLGVSKEQYLESKEKSVSL